MLGRPILPRRFGERNVALLCAFNFLPLSLRHGGALRRRATSLVRGRLGYTRKAAENMELVRARKTKLNRGAQSLPAKRKVRGASPAKAFTGEKKPPAAQKGDFVTERMRANGYDGTRKTKRGVTGMPFSLGRRDAAPASPGRRLVIDSARCPQNHACPAVRVCPVGALSQIGHGLPAVDEIRCIRCGKCVRFCPMKAITLQ